MFGKRKKQVVGCDVGSSSIKIVELKPLKNGEFQLLHAAIANLSPEAIVDGAIMDSSLVVEALSRLIADNNIRNPGFGGSLSGHSVIIKKIQLPAMTEAELAESIQWEAEQYIPFDINDVNLDYVVLDAPSADTMDILLGGGQEGPHRRLHVGGGSGRQRPGAGRRRRVSPCRTPTRPTTPSTTRRWLWSTSAPR